jgi:tRNA (Thr-GGU) A37 N-methylase
VVRLRAVEGRILHIENVDILDGTPLLDIKPCVPGFDALEDVRTGWVERAGRDITGAEADDRFV